MANVTPFVNLHASQCGASHFLRGDKRRAGIRR